MGFTTETTKVKINEHDNRGGESISTEKKRTRKEKERGKRKQKKNRTASVCGKISSGIKKMRMDR